MRGVRALLMYLSIVSFPATAGLFRVRVQHDVVRFGYDLTTQEKRRAKLVEEGRKLRVELEAERMPTRLRQMALDLGMAPPPPSSIILKRGLSNLAQARVGGFK